METRAITLADQAQHLSLLEDYFQLRKRLFVDGAGWTGPTVVSGFEVDFWDTPPADPVHFTCVDEAGQCVGCARVVRATRPTMFEHLFAKYLTAPHAKTDSLIEINRFGIDQSQPPPARKWATLKMLLAIGEWAVANDVQRSMMLTAHRIAAGSQNIQFMEALGPPINGLLAIGGDFTETRNEERRLQIARLLASTNITAA